MRPVVSGLVEIGHGQGSRQSGTTIGAISNGTFVAAERDDPDQSAGAGSYRIQRELVSLACIALSSAWMALERELEVVGTLFAYLHHECRSVFGGKRERYSLSLEDYS